MAPWAEICYFADAEWFGWHKDKPEFKAFAGEKCSIQNTGASIEDGSVHILRNKNYPSHGSGLSADPECLVTGGNSGWQAINLAVLAGAKTIILLGFDCRDPVGKEPSHWFGHHVRREPVAAYAMMRKSFREGAPSVKAAGVRVVNCSPNTAIDAFERMDLEKALRLEPDS